MREKYITLQRPLLQDNIENNYNLSPMFFSLSAILRVHQSEFNDFGNISLSQIYEYFGYKIQERRKSVFIDVLQAFKDLTGREMIELQNVTLDDLNNIAFDNIIKYKITDKFYDKKSFFKIPYECFQYIFCDDELVAKKENVFLVLCYITSMIWFRPKYKGIEAMADTIENSPEAMWTTHKRLVEQTGLSIYTVKKCLDYLTQDQETHPAILRFMNETQIVGEKSFKQLPTVYAYQSDHVTDELMWGLKKLRKQRTAYSTL